MTPAEILQASGRSTCKQQAVGWHWLSWSSPNPCGHASCSSIVETSKVSSIKAWHQQQPQHRAVAGPSTLLLGRRKSRIEHSSQQSPRPTRYHNVRHTSHLTTIIILPAVATQVHVAVTASAKGHLLAQPLTAAPSNMLCLRHSHQAYTRQLQTCTSAGHEPQAHEHLPFHPRDVQALTDIQAFPCMKKGPPYRRYHTAPPDARRLHNHVPAHCHLSPAWQCLPADAAAPRQLLLPAFLLLRPRAWASASPQCRLARRPARPAAS